MRAAVIGLGWWGRQLVESLAESDIVEITDVVEPRVDEAEGFAARHELRLHARLDDVLEIDGIEGVLLATPHKLHEGQVIDAAAAGKHVYCEKPLALDSAAARRMIAACTDRGLALGVGHERRFEGALEAMASMASSGELGTLLHVECNWSHDLFAGTADQGWRQDPDQAPLGTLTALGVHLTDYLQSVAGRVAEVRTVATHRSPRTAMDDVLTVQLRFESDVTGVITDLASTPFYSRITIFGDAAWVEAREFSNVDVPEPALLTWRGADGELRTRTFAATSTVRANVDSWARSAVGDGAYRFTADQLLHNVEILEAIVESARSGGAVTIPEPG